MSLQRFLTRLIWFCILPLGLLAIYLATNLIRNAQDDADRQAQHLARSAINAIDHHLNARLGALDMLAMSPLVDQVGRWKDVYEQGQSFRQSFGTHVIFSDAHNNMLFNTRLPFGAALPMMPKVHGAMPAQLVASTGVAEVSNVFTGPMAKEPVVSLSVPVSRAGKTVYVMATHIETSQFRFRLDELALPITWSITLVDGKGTTMAERGPKRGVQGGVDEPGRSYEVKSLASPWSVRVFIPQSTYFSPLIDTTLAMVAAILAATLAGLVGGKLASRRLGQQLVSLADQPSFGTFPADIAEIATVRALIFEAYERQASTNANRRASEQRFRGVFEQASVGISLVATDGRILLANQRLCDITGFTHAELTAKKFQDFTFPADLDADLMLMERVVLHEINTYTLEKRYVQKSGAVLWVNLSVSVVRRTDGSPEYFISLVEDIDRQKHAQTALLENQAALNDAQRLAGLGNWTWDLISNVTYWSPEMYRIFGRDPQLPPVGYPEVRAYFPPGSWASLNTIVQECVKTGAPYEREIELVLADGSPRWISAHGQAKRNADGGIVGINGTVQDITLRTLDQRKLRLNDLAFKTISQGVLITDASGLIISSNEAFGTITGYCEPDILGKKCNFVQGPLTDPKTINSLRWAVDNGAAFTGEIFNYHKSGYGFWNDLAITPVRDGDGKLTHFIGIIRDISERKLAEAALAHHQLNLETLISTRTNELVLAREAAEAANHAKSAFLATMSHELRTPLNAVVGLTGLLSDSPLGRRQRDYAEKIDLSAQALRTLVDDILDFSRIEAGGLPLEHGPFSLHAILRATSATMGIAIGSKPIEALFDVDADVPDALVGDALRLQQILLNLTGNAVKFTETGEVVVSVRCVQKTTSKVTVQISVRDTGIGIEPDQLEAVFGQFVQAAPSTHRTYGGAGLGLAICQRLAHLMEGQITARSTLEQGSEFTCTVTLARSPETISAESVNLEPPLNLRILVVDDHPLSRDILVKNCATFGWHAAAVGSGPECLAELRKSAAAGQDYDLLLLDWRMPGMDGIEMLHAALAAPDIGLPLVVLMASITELEQAAAASDNLYLDGIAAKPLCPAGMREAVTRAYAGDTHSIEPAPTKSRPSLRGMRLLVAEDNDLNQEVIFQVLTRAGAEVVMTNNGQEAVDAVRKPGAVFDAVLMDLQMPVLDGYGATRVIREELGLLDLPIIAVTAFVRPEDREHAQRAGMVGFIAKPLDVDRLLDVLMRECRGPWRDVEPHADDAKPLEILDMDAALSAFGGDKAKYHALLQQFIARHGDDAFEAQRRFDANDAETAKGLVHGLNGMASILKADQLAMLAIATESALWDGNSATVSGLFQALQSAMGALSESVKNLA